MEKNPDDGTQPQQQVHGGVSVAAVAQGEVPVDARLVVKMLMVKKHGRVTMGREQLVKKPPDEEEREWKPFMTAKAF